MLEAFIHGIILAFGLILPLGVQNVFVFNQGATQPSFIRALPVVLTASICDSLMILLAVLGVSIVVFSFTWLKTTLIVVGVFFLLYMGWSLWKTKPGSIKTDDTSFSPKKQVMFAASVSLLNPHAILDIVGVIGTSSLNYEDNEKWMFTIATIVVSWLWFLGLALAGKLVRSFNESGNWILYMNKLSALIVWGTAIYLVVSNF
ncbi:LysE/ArgO family amino acid transporter [Cytobacillus sp. FJAT-54145]|uniref:LysE/ArgO family amino acid transporter n=1 Tax=Cytobacillus spartinae TaxID=3299023 RepID=A0ABW6KFC6_9BACI